MLAIIIRGINFNLLGNQMHNTHNLILLIKIITKQIQAIIIRVIKIQNIVRKIHQSYRLAQKIKFYK